MSHGRKTLIDYHIHTRFSEDSLATPEECVADAAERGLGGVIFTEHLEFPPPPDWPEPAYHPGRVLDARAYQEAVSAVRDRWAGTLDVGLGAELGLEPHNLKALGPYLDTYDPGFDIVIGSLHSIRGVLVQLPEYTDPLGPQAASREYFGSLYAGVREAVQMRAFDVLGHLDLVKRSPTFGVFRAGDHRELLREILVTIIREGLGVEVNTSGYRQPPGEPYPGLETLRLFRELGGEIVTVGSDSHRAATVGQESARALDFIRAAGFRRLALFRARHPTFVPI